MHLRAIFALFLAITAVHAELPRIDPAGIDGTLLCCGKGNPPRSVIDHFLNLTGGDKANIVTHSDAVARQLPRANVVKAISKDTLSEATGLWLTADALSGDPAKEAVRAMLARGGILAVMPGKDPKASIGDLLPDAIPGDTAKPGQVAYDIAAETALLVKGRSLSVLGDGKVTIRLAASRSRPIRTIVLENKKSRT